jgi:hypothetical protein
MRILQFLLVLFASVFLAACSTTINVRQPLAEDLAGTLRFGPVEAKSNLSRVTADDLAQLKQAVATRVARLPRGERPVTIELAVMEFDIVSAKLRFLVGALAGATKMSTLVKVTDEFGKTLTEFEIHRSANPGGNGAFYDQRSDAIYSIADGVVEVLCGKSDLPKDK